VIFWVLI